MKKLFKMSVFLSILTMASLTTGCAVGYLAGSAAMWGVSAAAGINSLGPKIGTGGPSSPGRGVGSEQDLASEKFAEIAARKGSKPPPMIQSSEESCPGWALLHIALKHPMAKATEIIEKMTTPKSSWLDYDTSPEMVAVGAQIKQTCANPDPSMNYRKLGWVCPQGDLECPKKEAFTREVDALKTVTKDRAVFLKRFREIVQRYKSQSA